MTQDKLHTQTVGFSLEVLESKIRTFQDKQRQWITAISKDNPIQILPEINFVLTTPTNNDLQILNYRFQLMFNRIKRLMDTESTLIQRLSMDVARSIHLPVIGQTPRGQNFELYQLLNDSNKATSTLEGVNSVLISSNRALQQQITQLKLKLRDQQQKTQVAGRESLSWQVEAKGWEVQREHIRLQTERLSASKTQMEECIDKLKERIMRQDIQKQNLNETVCQLRLAIKDQETKALEHQQAVASKIACMKTQLSEQIATHVNSTQVQETVSFKILKKLCNRVKPVS